jgi:hypothetical protein
MSFHHAVIIINMTDMFHFDILDVMPIEEETDAQFIIQGLARFPLQFAIRSDLPRFD